MVGIPLERSLIKRLREFISVLKMGTLPARCLRGLGIRLRSLNLASSLKRKMERMGVMGVKYFEPPSSFLLRLADGLRMKVTQISQMTQFFFLVVSNKKCTFVAQVERFNWKYK